MKSMSSVERSVASLVVQTDKAFGTHCVNTVHNLNMCKSNTMSHVLIALMEPKLTPGDSVDKEILQAALQAVGDRQSCATALLTQK